jgi:signal transduction histidine kinase
MQFVANASHELRTPLATMRASLDVAMAKGGPVPAPMAVLDERLRRELDHVDRLLDSFLSLAQSGSVWLSLAQSGSVWLSLAQSGEGWRGRRPQSRSTRPWSLLSVTGRAPSGTWG